MKRLLSYISLSASLSVAAGENEIAVKSAGIREVTVFLNGAGVHASGGAVIPAGASEVVFGNLSPYINANSIQAGGEGAFTILAVTHRINHLNQQPKTREITLLEDSLENLQNKLEYQKNLRAVYESEESFLLSNRNIGGANTGVSSAELEKIAAILRSRLADLKSKQLEIKNAEKKLNEIIVKVSGQLNELNAKRNRSTGEIVVSVASKTGGEIRLSVSYAVSNAGWSPYYDIRTTDTNGPVQLNYRANVYQNTGEDWKNVKITLSTGNPALSGTKPTLNPWWLSFDLPRKDSRGMKSYGKVMSETMPSQAAKEGYGESKAQEADYASDYTTVEEAATTVEYQIGIPYTVPSDGHKHSVDIQSYNIPAAYRYYCAPRLDKDAFLVARISGWDSYNLLSGEAGIYFDGTYVGKSYLNTSGTGDTLDLSLGRDRNVNITRTLLRDLTEKKIVGIYRKETHIYEIALRNRKKQEISIQVEDQVPLSRMEEVTVEALEMSGASYNAETGKLTWDLKLAPSEEKKLRFGFSVKYPKEKVITNL